MMILHDIVSAKYSKQGPSANMELVVDATIEGERNQFPFAYSPSDPYGLSADVAAWLKAHPDFKISPYTAPPPEPTTLPDLAPFQFRAMLKLSGKQDDLYAFIEALPEPDKTIAQSKLEYSLVFKRDNSLVIAAQDALGLSTEQLDALWLQAYGIE